MSAPPTQPIQIHIPPTLSHLTLPLPTFLTSHPHYTSFATSTLIFSPSHKHILLLQRAASEHGFPNKYEPPGGSIEAGDPTLLHSAARETFEETGLRLTRFVRMVGEEYEFSTGKGRDGRWLKFVFEIRVQEIGEGCGHEHVQEHGKEQGNAGLEIPDVEITLDLAEHQAYVWASEDDVRADQYPITTEQMRERILEAFQLHRGEREVVKNMVDGPAGGEQGPA